MFGSAAFFLCSAWLFLGRLQGGEAAAVAAPVRPSTSTVPRPRVGLVKELHAKAAVTASMSVGKGPSSSASTIFPPAGSDTADGRFGESKRRAPSCPDPLHNR